MLWFANFSRIEDSSDLSSTSKYNDIIDGQGMLVNCYVWHRFDLYGDYALS